VKKPESFEIEFNFACVSGQF